MGYVYAGESGRGRIIRCGIGYDQVGDPYEIELRTWDLRPVGDVGECVFRTVLAVIRHTAGYSLQITPVLDGVPLTPQRFTGGPPDAAKLEDVVSLEALVFTTGNAISAIIESVDLPGELELIDLAATYFPIRTAK